jgi:hypothetical protein
MSISHRVGLITVLILIAAMLLFRLDYSKQVSAQHLSGITYDLFPLSKYDLVHDSELIILGNVLEQKSAGTVGEEQTGVPKNLTVAPAILTTLGVEKIIKGNYSGNKIGIITEGDLSGKITFEGPAKFHKGEKAILFLHREQGYGGEYTTMGMDQGKFQVDSNGLVEAKNNAVEGYWPLNASSLAVFEADIKTILSQPKPEPIAVDSTPYDRDLTTEEIEKLERNTTGDSIVK